MFHARRLKKLLDRLAEADADEAESLWEEIIPIVRRFIRRGLRRHGASADEVDDVEGEVLLKMIASRDGLAERLRALPPADYRPFLQVTGARELHVQRRRREKREPEVLPNEFIQPLGGEPEPDERERALAALAGLDPKQRFILRALMTGYQIVEVHEALGRSGTTTELYRDRDQGIAVMLRAIGRPESEGPRRS